MKECVASGLWILLGDLQYVKFEPHTSQTFLFVEMSRQTSKIGHHPNFLKYPSLSVQNVAENPQQYSNLSWYAGSYVMCEGHLYINKTLFSEREQNIKVTTCQCFIDS